MNGTVNMISDWRPILQCYINHIAQNPPCRLASKDAPAEVGNFFPKCVLRGRCCLNHVVLCRLLARSSQPNRSHSFDFAVEMEGPETQGGARACL